MAQNISKGIVMCQISNKYIRKIIFKIFNHIPKESLYYDDKIKIESPDPHITIYYGLAHNNIQNILSCFEDFRKIKIQFKTTSLFDHSDKPYKVLKFDLISEDLIKLNRIIQNNLNVYPPDFKEYIPHVTIAYLKNSFDATKYTNLKILNNIYDISTVIKVRTFEKKYFFYDIMNRTFLNTKVSI